MENSVGNTQQVEVHPLFHLFTNKKCNIFNKI